MNNKSQPKAKRLKTIQDLQSIHYEKQAMMKNIRKAFQKKVDEFKEHDKQKKQ